MKIALDTNVLVYAEGANDLVRHDTVMAIVRALPVDAIVVPVQVLGELFNVQVRKAGQTPAEARAIVLRWQESYETVPTTPEIMAAAMDIAAQHQLRIWDAVILAAAARAGCRLLLSEDLQDGFSWGGVTVVSPFAEPRHWLLASLLAQGGAGR
ncbi:MAG: PIN domain-containing protein [Thermomicrobiales bacterium]